MELVEKSFGIIVRGTCMSVHYFMAIHQAVVKYFRHPLRHTDTKNLQPVFEDL